MWGTLLEKDRKVTDSKDMTEMFDSQYCFVLTMERSGWRYQRLKSSSGGRMGGFREIHFSSNEAEAAP